MSGMGLPPDHSGERMLTADPFGRGLISVTSLHLKELLV
jgi:hypothetical protein